MPTAHFRTRPPDKQDAIVAHLRQLIVDEELRPGDRLPPRTALETQFRVSTVTVQRAFDRLVDDGFVRVAGRSGTFVAAQPPHTHRYVLAFSHRMGEPGWVRFWTVLANVAQANGSQRPFRLSIGRGNIVARPDRAGGDSADDPEPVPSTPAGR